MQRRDFIKIIATGTVGAVLVPSLLTGCNTTPLRSMESWEGPSTDQKDIRILVLSYAVLAANPHNKQPWIIELTSPTSMKLFVDQTRLLPETDPPARQIHIGQGTFLENLALAAKNYGYEAKIQYFPEGMYANDVVLSKPVASINLVPRKTENDPLFPVITKRQSNKREYDAERHLSPHQVQQLKSTFDGSEHSLHITQDPTLRKKIAAILGKSMKIETRGHKRHIETMEMFRLNDQELEKYRDGFGVAQIGMTGIKGWVAETFFLGTRADIMDPESDASKAGIDAANDTTQKQADSAPAFAWIVSKTNTRLDQVQVGRLYQRINLEATRLGLGQHPMSQVLQEYEEMAALQKEFLALLNVPEGHTVQMMFRLGHADSVPHTPRREIKSLINA